MAKPGGFRTVRNFFIAATLPVLFLAVHTLEGAQQAPTVTVTVNKSLVFGLAQKARRVSVTQPEVAEVVVLSPNQLLINGKSVGTTSLIVWPESGEIVNYDLMVIADVAALRSELRTLFPNEKVEASTSAAAIVLRGEVSNEVVYDKVLEVVVKYLPPRQAREVAAPNQTVSVRTGAEVRLPSTGTAFAGGGTLAFPEEESPTDVSRWPNKRDIPGVIDLLSIKEYHLIQLNVVIAEVDSLKARDIGLDFRASGNNYSFFSNLGSQAGFPTQLFVRDPTPGSPLTFGSAVSGILQYRSGAFQLLALYRLLQNRDVTQILAQPNLVIKNGRAGGFLAGGEFPVVTTLQDVFAVEFKPFGVRLDFLPTVTWSNTIDLRVFPEVSEIDQAVAVQGVPGLKVRRTVTRVEMQDGDSLVISGLLDKRILKDLTKYPLLGDIPILGAIFRSTRFRNQETELVFVITPKIVKVMKPGEKPQLPSLEKYDDPDIRQVPLPSQPSRAPAKPMPQGPTIP